MNTSREAAVAGMFYPADKTTLKKMVQQLLKQAETTGTPPKAIIAPHAGYIYSGPVAASAYHLLEPCRDLIKRVVLLGPSHRVPLLGLAASSAESFSTPLGQIPIDQTTLQQLVELPQVAYIDQAHTLEHSLEVHLPFLQIVLNEFNLVPLVIGDTSPELICEVLEHVSHDEGTLIVISSDLSHYHSYEVAKQMDAKTSKAIEQLQPEKIGYDDACGRIPVRGLLVYARKHNWQAETIDLRNSGDTAGPRDEVVGYGAYVFH